MVFWVFNVCLVFVCVSWVVHVLVHGLLFRCRQKVFSFSLIIYHSQSSKNLFVFIYCKHTHTQTHNLVCVCVCMCASNVL